MSQTYSRKNIQTEGSFEDILYFIGSQPLFCYQFVTSNLSSTCLYTYKKHLFSTKKLCRINPPNWVNPALPLPGPKKYGILSAWENHRAKAATLHHGGANPPDQKGKEGIAMITYQDFFLFCTFVVALISLIYQILKDERK